jgi:hypothetical protein
MLHFDGDRQVELGGGAEQGGHFEEAEFLEVVGFVGLFRSGVEAPFNSPEYDVRLAGIGACDLEGQSLPGECVHVHPFCGGEVVGLGGVVVDPTLAVYAIYFLEFRGCEVDAELQGAGLRRALILVLCCVASFPAFPEGGCCFLEAHYVDAPGLEGVADGADEEVACDFIFSTEVQAVEGRQSGFEGEAAGDVPADGLAQGICDVIVGMVPGEFAHRRWQAGIVGARGGDGAAENVGCVTGPCKALGGPPLLCSEAGLHPGGAVHAECDVSKRAGDSEGGFVPAHVILRSLCFLGNIGKKA